MSYVMDLAADEDEQQIFDTINSLGVRLTTSELLKNYFFSRQNPNEYQEYWHSIFEEDDKDYWDKDITVGRRWRNFMDLFFFSFLQIKLQDQKLGVKDKDSFAKVDKLFNSYKRFIAAYYSEDNKIAVLNEIRPYAKAFRKAFDFNNIERELPSEPCIERINAIIFALDTATIIPYVLFVESNVQDEATRNALYGYLEAYIMRRIVTRETAKNYNQLFAERLILNRVLTKDALAEYLGGKAETVNRMPEDVEVRKAFHEKILTNKQAAGVLYLIESAIRDNTRHSTRLLGLKSYTLEHIMPKKWHAHWPLTNSIEDIRNRKLLTLGNLTIITQPLNSSLRNSAWNIKRDGDGTARGSGLKAYSNDIEIFSPFLASNVWDETTIESRADFLADKALHAWSEKS